MWKLTIIEMQDIATERGGRCLSDKYINNQTKLSWRCKEGHEWNAIPTNIMRGCWCPKCSDKIRALKKTKHTIQEMQEFAEKRGGKCLSEKYKSTDENLLWQCSEGHIWEATAYSIINKDKPTWCPHCAGSFPLNIGLMKKIAAERGGECLSKEYKNNATKLLWRCNKGHEWQTVPASIRSGQWCPSCARVARLTIEEMHTVASSNKGKCLSDKIINQNTKLLWQCKDGHKWWAIPKTMKTGHWCPECAGTTPLSLEDMKKIALERGGNCLSEIYTNNRTPLLWECKERHQWKAQPSNIKLGNWCKVCAGLSPITIDEMKELAINKGGQCLSDSCTNNMSKLHFKCSEGHEWYARLAHIKAGSSWCPTCSNYYVHEELVRTTFENIFKEKFIKCHPNWLKVKGVRNLELDGYNEKLAIAFEYQGEQHFEERGFYHKKAEDRKSSLAKRKSFDQLKRDLCKQNNVVLIEIPYTIKPKEYRDYIVNKCIQEDIKITKS